MQDAQRLPLLRFVAEMGDRHEFVRFAIEPIRVARVAAEKLRGELAEAIEQLGGLRT